MFKKITTLQYIRHRKKKIHKNSDKEGLFLLEILYISINKLHSKKESEKYWSIILTPCFWIIHEHLSLVDILKKDQIPLLKEELEIPLDCKSLHSMGMNNRLINSIIYIKKKFDTQNNLDTKDINYFIQNKEKISKKKILFNFINFLFNFKKKKVALDLFNLELFLRILLSGMSPSIINYNYKNIEHKNYNLEKRKELYNIGLAYCKNELIKKKWFVISHLLPCSLVENFFNLESLSKKTFKLQPNIITLSNIRKNELENIWIAENLKKKTRLQIYQYGFGPLIQNYDFNEIHEQKHADVFFSWAKSNKPNIINYPIFYKLKNKNNNSISGLVLINSDWPFFYRNQCGPYFESVRRNFFDQINFIDKVRNNFTNILIKNPSYSFDLYQKNNLKFDIINRENIYKIKRQSSFVNNYPWEKSVNNSHFPICSYIGTTFLILMANDVPNLLFSRYSDFNFNDKFSKYMKEYKKFNFYHYHPNKAADYLIKNKEDLNKIWNEKKFKDFREEFRYEFCNIKNNWQYDFAKKIIEN